MLIKVTSTDTAVVVAALSKHVRKLADTLRRSLTWDRGLEMAKHKDFTVATDVKAYFCDWQSPGQRGTNASKRCPNQSSVRIRSDSNSWIQATHCRTRCAPNPVLFRFRVLSRPALTLQTRVGGGATSQLGAMD